MSTDQNPNWSQPYSAQPEILDYLRNVAQKRKLIEKIQFGHKLVGGAWDDAQKQYTLQFQKYNKGGELIDTEAVTANVVISASRSILHYIARQR